MSKRKIFSIVAGLVGVCALGGWAILHNGHQEQFRTGRVERGPLEASISATGTTNAVVTVQVGSQVSGNIKELYADFNTKVKKGQLVALIDPQIFEARVQQAQANVDNARASVLNYTAQIQKAAADVSAAQANVQFAKQNVAKAKVATLDAKSKLDRRMDLGNQGILSKEDMETARATYDANVAGEDAANSQVRAAEDNLRAARASQEVVSTQLASARAQVAQNEAALRQASIDLGHTRILAPVDGTVIARRMDVGQTVAASFQLPILFEIAQDLTKMQVDTNVDEADIGRVQVGHDATFTVDAYPGVNFRGKVVEIRKAPINVQNVITYDAVVAVDNPDLKLFPGMTANVKALVDHRESALKVPNAALRFRPVGVTAPAGGQRSRAQTVWILGEDGKPAPVQVTLGITDGAMSEVTGGNLSEGREVIVGTASPAAGNRPAQPFGGGGRRGPGF